MNYLPEEERKLVERVQALCANIAERDEYQVMTPVGKGADWAQALWGDDDVRDVAAVISESDDPIGLFRFMDEKTGSTSVGYKTSDGHQWFHILRQMRNSSGIFFDLLKEDPVYDEAASMVEWVEEPSDPRNRDDNPHPDALGEEEGLAAVAAPPEPPPSVPTDAAEVIEIWVEGVDVAYPPERSEMDGLR
jgi:hypothetical protein